MSNVLQNNVQNLSPRYKWKIVESGIKHQNKFSL